MRPEKTLLQHLVQSIREATSSDVRSLARVHVDTWWETYKNIISDEYLYSLKYTDRQLMWEKLIPRKQDQGSTLIVPDERDDVVGFADFGPAREHEHGIDGEIYALCLLKRYHGNGIGRKLLEQIKWYFSSLGYTSFYIWVLQDSPTKGFYEKMGGKYLQSQPVIVGKEKLIEDLFYWEF